jgi:hypothetical protein
LTQAWGKGRPEKQNGRKQKGAKAAKGYFGFFFSGARIAGVGLGKADYSPIRRTGGENNDPISQRLSVTHTYLCKGATLRLAVATQLDALDAELARHEAQVPALVRLIAVAPATALPPPST